MNYNNFELTPNKLERYLGKYAYEFTKNDIIKFVIDNEIEMINFRYIAGDGKLKTLNFVISDLDHLDQILTTGERVDGSSLFDFIGADSSDLYVIPRYRTAFVNPFENNSLDILCAYYNNEGKPLSASPEYILMKAHENFKATTGYTFKALGELEYYIIDDISGEPLYPAFDQKGYHSSEPYAKFEYIRREAMQLIASCGGKIKYGHSEVGRFTDSEHYYEQQEIEFLPCEAELACEQMIIAKWILRKICEKNNLLISFAPKITVGKAGSGLHIHMMLSKDGKNQMVENNHLSSAAKKMIAGILELSPALTAFGNTIPTSYLRLVPHQEAPTNICWGDRNRSVLVRVPLGWTSGLDMIKEVNPQDKSKLELIDSKQTVEIRSGDGSADVYLYMASLIVACKHGLENDHAMELAEKLYVNVNIFLEEHKDRLAQLEALPNSCYQSAEALEKMKSYFLKDDIFPEGLLDSIINKLKSYNDKNLSEELYGNNEAIAKLVKEYLHCM